MFEAWYDIHGLVKIHLHVSEKNPARIIDTILSSFKSAPIETSQVNLEFFDSRDNTHIQETFRAGDFNYSASEQMVWDSHCAVKAEASGKISVFSDAGIDDFVLTFLLLIQLSRKGFALCHAMAIAKENGAILFPAWKYTGKTGLFNFLIEKEDVKILGDELLLLKDKDVYGLPLPVNIQHYHASGSATALGKAFKKRRSVFIGKCISTFNDYVAKPLSSVLSGISPGLVRSLRRFAPSRRVAIPLNEIVSPDKIIDRAPLNKIITLVRSSNNEMKVEPVKSDETIPGIIGMLYCGELFSSPNVVRFQKYWLVLYAFNAVESWQSILSTFERVLEDTLSNTQCYRVTIPEKTQMSEIAKFVEGVI